MNTGVRQMSAMNPYLPFRTGVYPQPNEAGWMAAAVLLFAQLADAPLEAVARLVQQQRIWVGLRIGL